MEVDAFDFGQVHHKDHRGDIQLVFMKQQWALPRVGWEYKQSKILVAWPDISL